MRAERATRNRPATTHAAATTYAGNANAIAGWISDTS
jgi:hypothetical protein